MLVYNKFLKKQSSSYVVLHEDYKNKLIKSKFINDLLTAITIHLNKEIYSAELKINHFVLSPKRLDFEIQFTVIGEDIKQYRFETLIFNRAAHHLHYKFLKNQQTILLDGEIIVLNLEEFDEYIFN